MYWPPRACILYAPAITSPVFDKVTLKLDPKYAKGRAFTIVAKNNLATNIYIQSARLNGKAYSKCYLDYKDIAAGGTLELTVRQKKKKKG
jgi:putative alpha-1,2-mannosidase